MTKEERIQRIQDLFEEGMLDPFNGSVRLEYQILIGEQVFHLNMEVRRMWGAWGRFLSEQMPISRRRVYTYMRKFIEHEGKVVTASEVSSEGSYFIRDEQLKE